MKPAHLGARGTWRSVAISFIMAGTALRLLGCLSQGQFYVDDARIALNIASRSLGDLTRHLDYGQAAPIPFLWLEKLMTQVGGVNEFAFRAAPLVASIAALVLLWTVGRRALGERPAVVATCLGAFSTFLIGFAAVPKQYSGDALVTLLLVWLVLEVLRAADNNAAWVRLGAGGAVALWISHPAVFVLAGASLALPASTAVRANPGWWRRYALTAIAWLSAFAVLYFFVYRTSERDSYLRGYWGWTFLTPGAPDSGGRVWRAARAILVPPVWRGGTLAGTPLILGGVTFLAFLGGLAAIFRTYGPSLTALCAGPYVAVLGAAMIGKYPPADRFLLFAAPLLLFIYASAVCWVATALPPPARGQAVAAALVLLTLWSYPTALEQGLHPERRRETKTLLRTVETQAPGAPVYLLASAAWYDGSVWAFYTTDWHAPDTARLGRFAGVWRRGVAARSSEGGAPPNVEAISSRVGRHEEIIGAGARIRYARDGIARSPEPDPGWVDAESDRIKRAANPVVWLWAAEQFPENAIAALLHGIRLRGGRLIFASRVLGATAWEVDFSKGDSHFAKRS